jgi:hypothetical protein
MKSNVNKNRLHDEAVDVTPEERTSCELVTLIRKLRWIGLEAEAGHLQAVLRKIPPDRRIGIIRSSTTLMRHMHGTTTQFVDS